MTVVERKYAMVKVGPGDWIASVGLDGARILRG